MSSFGEGGGDEGGAPTIGEREMSDPRVAALKRQLQDLETQKVAIEGQLRALLAAAPPSEAPSPEAQQAEPKSKATTVAGSLSSKAKIALFRRLSCATPRIWRTLRP